jgi:uncharacterized membrane protein YwzB
MLGDIIILILESLGFKIGEKVKVNKGKRTKILFILVIVLAIGLVISNFK